MFMKISFDLDRHKLRESDRYVLICNHIHDKSYRYVVKSKVFQGSSPISGKKALEIDLASCHYVTSSGQIR